MIISANEILRFLELGKNSTEESRKLASCLNKLGVIYIEYKILTVECEDGFIGDVIRKFIGVANLKELINLNELKIIAIAKIEIRK